VHVLVTGGTGIIGSLTGRLLAERGHSVRLLDARPEPSAVPGNGYPVEVVRGDVLRTGDLEAAVRDVDTVVHLAYSLGADTSARPYPATALNVQGTANVLEAARAAGVGRAVLASSVAIYGSDGRYAADELPLDEGAATHLSPGMALYGAGKLYLEQLAEAYRSAYGLLSVGIRPSPVYGPGGVRGVSGWLAELVERPVRGQPVTLDRGDARISLVYVADVAEQLVRLVELPAERFDDPALQGRRFFNTGGDATTIRELAGLVRELVPGAQIEVTSSGEPDVAGLPTRVSGRALAELLGYDRQYDLRAGLAAHVDAVRARG
jgi:UDP-glucose 4-epimerase